jgi:NAD(P)-dependent dehydrogenase (short-subunit alcohol dehydrogenase family)
MNIIITGTSQGIGFELTQILAQRKDVKIIAVSRNTAPLESLKNHENVRPLALDITQSDQYGQLTDLVDDFFDKKLNILINNAGALINNPVEQFSEADFHALFDVNVKAPFFLVQKLLTRFVSPAHIVNISSMAGFQGSSKFSGLSLYSASKGALSTLTESLAEELKPHNIAVNALALGAVDTEMLRKAFPGQKASVKSSQMAAFIAGFALSAYHIMNGKIIPVSLSTP